jgi:hypothetical protein
VRGWEEKTRNALRYLLRWKAAPKASNADRLKELLSAVVELQVLVSPRER